MKILGTLLLGILGIIGFKYAEVKKENEALKAHTAAPVATPRHIASSTVPSAPAPDSIRKFDLTIRTVIPGGRALADACFYDIPPSVNTSPERLLLSKGNYTQAGRVYVTGVPDGLIDGQDTLLWLTPTGTKTYNDVGGGFHTVPSYRVVSAPPEVNPKAAPGAWMHEATGALDKRTPGYRWP